MGSSAELDGHRRLPGHVRPLRCALLLDVDPGRPFFEGRVEISLDVRAETLNIDLHAERLDIATAFFEQGDRREAADVQTGPNGALRLALTTPALPGAARIVVDFSGPLDEVPEGLYRVREGDAWYAYTQFEPLSARRGFPCFDEPGEKPVFSVRLRTPGDMLGLANARCLDSRDLPDGRREFTFADTPPLSTYLVAFAVGDFDLVEAPPEAVPGVPLRLVTTRGRGHLTRFALECTPRILASLTRWFGMPYPYDKLDLVGVPNFAAGAMENAGMVTFRERLLLLDAERAPANDRLWAQVVIAHELAHMWFGNLVTMRWWDDLWLNEAFATWMEMACVAEVDPALEAGLEAVQEGLRVMDHDSLEEARAIRQPIVDGGDVMNAFDGITYSKGAAVVRMTESWLGAAQFQDGVRQYLSRHAHGNAETADLLSALAQVSGQPVAETLVTFLDQPGLPVIDMALRPFADGTPGLYLAQRRYLPDPESAAAQADGPAQRWHVPVVVRLGDAQGEITRHACLLTTPTAHLPLPACRAPTWLHPNAQEAGYYRWNLPPALLDALLHDGLPHLSPAERVGLPEHVWALLEADLLPLEAALAALEIIARDPHRLVLSGLCAALRRLSRIAPAEPWAAFVGGLLRPHVERLGVLPRPEDTASDRLLRPVLVTAAADAGALTDLIAPLATATGPLLSDLAGADPEVLQYALPIAAWQGDAALRDVLAEAVRHAPTPAHRAAALTALGGFGDVGVAEGAWALFFTDALRAQDFFALMRGATRRPATQRALWAWLDTRSAAVAEKIGDEAAANLPALSGGVNDAAGRAVVEAFFEPAERRKSGLERNLRQALEDIDRRIRLHGRLADPLTRALAVRRGT
jgi:alanyl aminopeptidase